jgi:hypothetical protein
MEIRVNCKTENVKRFKELLEKLNVNARVYTNRRDKEHKRIYFNIDDDSVMNKLENIASNSN